MNEQSKYKKLENKLQIMEFKDGIILPRKEIADEYPMWGFGGVCNRENDFVQQSFYDGDWATHGGKYEWEDEQYLDTEAVYIGMFYSHWGHFIVDLSNRFWALPKLTANNPGIKVAYLGEEEPKGNNLRFFELLGVKKEQLYHVTKPTRFKKIYVPEQSFKPNTWFSNEFSEMFDSLADKVIHSDYDFSKVKGIDKVYLTRRSYAKAVSSEFGEEFFEEFFRHNGYAVMAPERLSLEEQIYLWNKAHSIVCINGAITQNILFSCNKYLNWIVLNKTSIPHENPLFFQYIRGIRGRFLNVYDEPFKKYPKSLGEGPFLLKCSDEFLRFADENHLKSFQDRKQTEKQFRILKVKYIWAILNLKNRVKELLRKPYTVLKTLLSQTGGKENDSL